MLSYKDNYILTKLIKSNQNLNVADISKLLGISQRSVYYSLTRINSYLESRGLSRLNNRRRLGINVDPLTKEKLRHTLSDFLADHYLYTQEERNAVQILILLCFEKTINIASLEKIFSLCKNTILSDIKENKKKLSVYNLALEFDSNLGYIVEGTALRKRSVILNLISKYTYLLKINSYGLFSKKELKLICSKFTIVENTLNIRYVHNSLASLSILIAVIKNNPLERVTFADPDKAMLIASKEYNVVKEIFATFLEEDEILYITLHLLGLRVQIPYEFQNFENLYISEVVDFLILEFSKKSLIYFENRDQLFKDLYLHMKQALFRLKYGIVFENTIKDSVFENYPQVSHITKKICALLETQIGYPIGDDDIAYITMHFGGHLKREKKELIRYKVLLVCLNGIATSKLLKKEITSLIENVEIIDVVRLDEVEKYEDTVDFIISTVPFETNLKYTNVLQVDPILTDNDKTKILSLFGKSDLNYTNDVSKLIVNDIRQHINTNELNLIENIIRRHLKHNLAIKKNYKRSPKPMLKDLITKENIIFKNSVSCWEESIKLSASPLLNSGFSEDRYIDKIIGNVHELGPYIVVAPNIVISHARPDDGVNTLGMSLLVLKTPINFSETLDRNARVIVTLAAPDGEKHLLALQQLSTLLVESGDKLLSLQDSESILSLIDTYSRKDS